MRTTLTLARTVLARAERRGIGHVEAVVRRTDAALTRYARSEIHQNVASQECVLQIRVVVDGSVGRAATGRTDDAGIDDALDRAVVLARSGRPDAAVTGLPELGAGVVDLGAGTPVPASARAAVVADAVAAIPDGTGVELHGVVETVHDEIAIANSAGLVAATVRPSAWVVVLAMGHQGGTGYAEQRAASLEDIDVLRLATEACGDAVLTASTTPAPAAELPAVLSEYVAADLVAKTARLTFTAARVADGSSAYEFGARLGSPLVDLVDDGHDRAGVPRPFDSEGVRRRRVVLLDRGRAKELVHDTTTALAAGVASTGHALGHPDQVGPLATNLFLAPGTDSTADLVAGVDDGFLIRRVYYTNALDPRRVLMNGSTRDGLFRIRGGEVAEALAPARFSLSYLDLLRSVDGIGRDTRTVSGWYGGVHVLGDVTVPPLRVGAFRLGL